MSLDPNTTGSAPGAAPAPGEPPAEPETPAPGRGQGDAGEEGHAHAEVEVAPQPPPSREELERLAAERDEFLNALQLVKADFDNYRKRVERDRAAERRAAARDLLVELLPVMDNLERALAALADADASIRAGVEMVRDQLAGVLAKHGVVEIEALRQPFDPTIHEAVVQSHSPDHDEGTVVAVIEKGYRHDDTVIRPARVVVAAPRNGG